jgi:hypothetical protein
VSGPDDLAEETERDRAFGLDLADVDSIAAAIIGIDKKWQITNQPLGLSPIDWNPHLVSSDKRVCHIHVVSRLGNHWVQRMQAARAAGKQIVIAAPLNSWHSDQTLLLADELGAQAVLVANDDDMWLAKTYRSTGQLIAREKLLVGPATLGVLGARMLTRARKLKEANARGDSFEDFLAFLFSQVPEFEIFAQDYNTATEEIDLIVKNRNTYGRAWPPNAPLILVSGKNRKDVVGAPSVTSLASKVEKRRGMCRLGFLCTSGAISRDARDHELRYSGGDNVLVLIDGKTLDRLLGVADFPAELERLAVEAALR